MIKSIRLTLAGVLAAATLVVVAAAPASAHTALKSSTPEKGASVAPPSEITLTYTETVRLPRVIITNQDGARYEDGSAQASGDSVTQAVKGTLPNGTYTVGWRVVSTDGHPASGSYKFTVEGAPADAQPPPATAQPGGTSAANPAPTTTVALNQTAEGSSSGWLWIGLAALAIALIVGGIAWARRPSQE